MHIKSISLDFQQNTFKIKTESGKGVNSVGNEAISDPVSRRYKMDP